MLNPAIPFALPFAHYAKLGYHPIPIVPGDKRPAGGRNWQTRQYDYDVLDQGSHSVGILCDNVVGLDIDIIDEKQAKAVDALVCKTLNLPPRSVVRRVGRAPKRLIMCRVDAPVHGWDISDPNKRGKGSTLFQLLGVGKQFVIHGIHPETKKPYSLSKPMPAWSKLPLVTPTQLGQLRAALMDHFKLSNPIDNEVFRQLNEPVTSYPGPKWSMDQIHSYVIPCLERIPPDLDRPNWIRVGLALDAGGHHDEGMLDLWDAWSSGEFHQHLALKGGTPFIPNNYAEGHCAKQWKSFKPGAVGTGTLQALADKYDQGPAQKPSRVQKPNENVDKRYFSSALSIRDEVHPEIEEFLQNFLQIGATILHGPSKQGKSWLLLEAGEAVATGKPTFLDLPVMKAKVLIIGAEDPAQRFQKRLDIMGVARTDGLMIMTRVQLKEWDKANRPAEGWTAESFIETLYLQTGARVIALDTAEVVETRLEINHGSKGDGITRRDYLSTSVYDETAQRLRISVVLVAHWGMIRSVQMAALNPHEMINSTKAKLAGVVTSIALGPLPNQDLNDKSGTSQLALMGRDLTTGKAFYKISREIGSDGRYVDWRTTLEGDVRDVQLRESFSEVMVALESLGNKATSAALSTTLGMRADTLRKKVAAMRGAAAREGREILWKGKRFSSDANGYALV